MELKGSLPHSQKTATSPSPEPDQSSLFLPLQILVDPFYYYSVIFA